MSEQQPKPAPPPVSWADKMRLAKEQGQTVVNNIPTAVVVAPEISTAGKTIENSDKSKIDTTHTLFSIPDADKGTLVLDTNAFIKGFDNFLQTADVYITTAAVLQECRDRKTRDFLDRLPVAIEILEPTIESMKKVLAVAEKTGDLGMLSKTDLQLCALAMDVARQKNSLQPEITPGAPSVNATTVEMDESDDESGEDESDDESYDDEDEEEESDDEDEDDGNWLDDTSSSEDDANETDEKKKQENKKKRAAEKKKRQEQKEKEEAENKKKQASLPVVNLPGWGTFEDDWSGNGGANRKPGELSNNQKKKLAKEQKAAAAAAAATATANTSSVEAPQKTEEASVAPKKTVTIKETEEPAVAATQVEQLAKARQASAYTGGFSCVTSDFPMQNVLLHCGVPVVGSNGQCIRELRVWVLRCHACTAIVHDTLRQFCPECGSGDTLKRVHYVVNDKGEKHLFVNFRHKINTRGTIFNLSKPRGGRKGTNKTMVLREDQLRNCGKVDAKERFMKQQRENFDGLNDEEDVLAGFGERDSRNGRRDGNFMMEKSSYTRKNVTEARKVRASRKR